MNVGRTREPKSGQTAVDPYQGLVVEDLILDEPLELKTCTPVHPPGCCTSSWEPDPEAEE